MLATHIANTLMGAYQSLFCADGHAFTYFWGEFGYGEVLLVIGSPEVNTALRLAIEVVTKIIILLTLASLVKVLISLVHLVRKGRWRWASYIAFSNPVMNSYFLFVLIILLVYVMYFPSYRGQGRQWFPLIFPLFVNAAIFAPRVFASRVARRLAFYLITIGWLCYSLIGCYSAFGCVYREYYVRRYQPVFNIQELKPVTIDKVCLLEVTWLEYLGRCAMLDRYPLHGFDFLEVPPGKDIWIQWGVDLPAQAAASAVFIFVDDTKMYQATYGLPSPEVAPILNSDKYGSCGFGAIIPTNGLSKGKHFLTFKLVSGDGHLLYNTKIKVQIIVK